MEAGQLVESAPNNISFTAKALCFAGARQRIFFAAQIIGIVSVKAYCGTASRFGK
jgi:hypothetical protein